MAIYQTKAMKKNVSSHSDSGQRECVAERRLDVSAETTEIDEGEAENTQT